MSCARMFLVVALSLSACAEQGQTPTQNSVGAKASHDHAQGAALISQDAKKRSERDDKLRQALERELRPVFAELRKLGVRTGFALRGIEGKNWWMLRRSREAFVPASNMKLLSSAFVLDALGGEYELRTRFELVDDRVLRVVSGGDLCLGLDGQLAVFDRVAAALSKQGLRELAGVELDDSRWLGPTRPPTWPAGQNHRYFAAPTGPFALHEGLVEVVFDKIGGRKGAASVSLRPRGLALALRGRVQLVSQRRRGKAPIVRVGRGAVTVSGRYWSGFGRSSQRFQQVDPRSVYRASLVAALRRAKISVAEREDASAVVEAAAEAKTKARVIHVERTPLSLALGRVLQESVNVQAEQLLRVVALQRQGRADWRRGRELLDAYVEGFGERAEVADASGLSKHNKVTARLLATCVAETLGGPNARAMLLALPRAGSDGTLKKRMATLGARVRAKTGWVRGASALSGVVRTRADRLLSFSILMNYDPKRSGLNRSLKALQDRIVTIVHDVL